VGRNFAISLGLHLMMFVIAYVGLPSFRVDTDITDVPMSVEIVSVTDVTNMPTKPKTPKVIEKAAPVPPPKPPAPPPAPQGSVQRPPEPEPLPEAPPEQVALVVQPEAKPKPKAKAKEKPKPKDKPKKVDTKKRSPAPMPPRKPQPPDAFASVLKTLEELKQAPPPPPEQDFAKMMENALETDKQRTDVGPEMTISEIDLVRQQIHRCWNLPAGAKDAHTMLISIRIAMNPDGMVRTARVLDQSRMSSDPFYRAMAESALRAVLNPVCQPFKLPPEKFERWKNMKLNFDPKDMFGL